VVDEELSTTARSVSAAAAFGFRTIRTGPALPIGGFGNACVREALIPLKDDLACRAGFRDADR
jgi:hypothetical protein